MFASKTPRANNDPQPYPTGIVDPITKVEGRMNRAAARWVYGRDDERLVTNFHPRPEFDHVQHNEPNPILTAFRSDDKHVEIVWTPDRIAEWIAEETRTDMGAPDDYTDDQRLHARKVLTRLAKRAGVTA